MILICVIWQGIGGSRGDGMRVTCTIAWYEGEIVSSFFLQSLVPGHHADRGRLVRRIRRQGRICMVHSIDQFVDGLHGFSDRDNCLAL